MTKKISKLDLFMGLCMALCLSAMASLVFLNVILRYVFNSGITWSEEMSRYLFLFMTFFGIVLAFKDGQHLSVDFLIERCSPKVRKALALLSGGLMLFALALLIKGSWTLMVINSATRGPVTGMPLWLIYGGSLLMGLAMAGSIVLGAFRASGTRNT